MFLSAYPTEQELKQWYSELTPEQHASMNIAIEQKQKQLEKKYGRVVPLYAYTIPNNN